MYGGEWILDSNIDEVGDNGSDFTMPVPFKESGDNNPETIRTIYDIDSFGGVQYENTLETYLNHI